jgi:hypothetical protein
MEVIRRYLMDREPETYAMLGVLLGLLHTVNSFHMSKKMYATKCSNT